MKKLILLILGIGFLLTSCVKNPNPYIPPVDENFDWKTTESVSLNIPIEVSAKSEGFSATKSEAVPHAMVKVYSSPIFSEGSLIASGAAYSGMPFKTLVDIPKEYEQLFVKVIYHNGGVSLSSYDIVGSKAVKSLSSNGATKALSQELVVPKPTFPTKYDVTINKESDLPDTFTENKTYFIPKGANITTSKNLFENWVQTANPVLYVSGKLTIKPNVSFAHSTLVVLNGGEVVINGNAISKGSSTKHAIYVQKGGEITIEGAGNNFSAANMPIVNEGSMIFKNGVNINGGVKFYNTRSVNSGKDFAVENSCNLYQYGTLLVKTDFIVGGNVENYGKIECDGKITGDRARINTFAGSLLKAQELASMANSTFNLESGSIIYIYKNDNGNGNSNNWNVKFINDNKDGKDFALILWGVDQVHPDNAIINPKDETSFDGNIENYCPKKNDSQNEKYTKDYCDNNSFWGGRTHHIPDSDFNEGLGNMEEDPINPEDNIYVSYFPSKDTWGTYFFEDLWPHTGDYDMNDIVLGFQIVYYSKGEPTSNNNNVVYMDFNWSLRAVGSQMNLAMGIQLDNIIPAMISKIESNHSNLGNTPINKDNNGLESGQSKAVFALFNNPSELYGVSTGINVYIDPKAPRAQPVQKSVRITFANGISKDELMINNINPFIVTSNDNVPDRGKEIHLSTNSATDKINTNYYKQGVVSERNPFKATNGMVWGYMIPQVFRYPVEMCGITKAYPRFEDWYKSSGTEYNDWYNRDVVESNLYEVAIKK